MIKVCHLIDHMGLGGAQSIVVDLLESHSPAVSATVVSLRNRILPDLDARLSECGGVYRHLDLSGINPFGPGRIRRTLREGKFDVAHMHLDYCNSIGILMALSLGSARPLIVSHIHNNPWHQNTASFRATARLVAPRVDVHVVPSRSIITPTRSAFGERCRRLESISPGIDIGRFDGIRAVPGGHVEIRESAKLVIGYVGRLAKQKRIERLLRAMPAVIAAEPDARLIIAGEGPMQGFLETECRRLRIQDAVEFIGYLQRPEELFAAIDVFVLVSAYESFGIVVAEAMAAGVPVIAADIPGITDFVSDNDSGLLVNADDPAALSAGILKLHNDSPLREKLSATGREVVRTKFSREIMTHEFERLYESLLATRSN